MNFETLCLSLKTDVDRREHMIDVFNQMKIPVKFFDAFTSNDISYENERYFDECDFYQWNIKQKSVMATFISHMKMLEMRDYMPGSHKSMFEWKACSLVLSQIL